MYLEDVGRLVVVPEEEDPLGQARDLVVGALVADEVRGLRLEALQVQLVRVHRHAVPDQAQLELERDLVPGTLHPVCCSGIDVCPLVCFQSGAGELLRHVGIFLAGKNILIQ